jgi:hypothetical protein
MVLFSGISLAAGFVAALAAIAILSVVVSATHLLSSRPAYKIMGREHSSNGARP